MKILFPTWNFPPAVGGIETLVFNVFQGLSSRGHSVAVLTTKRRGMVATECVFAAPARGIAAFLAFCLSSGFSRMLRHRPDVLLCGSLVAAPAVLVLSKLFGVPWALIAYGGEIVHGGKGYQWFARFLFRKADLLLPISRHTRQLLRDTGVDVEGSIIVHPGVETRPFDIPEGNRPRDAKAGNTILTVGRLVRRKGVLEFVREVMPGLVRRIPELQLLIVGDDAPASLLHKSGGMREAIQAEIRNLGLEQNIQLLGQVSDQDLPDLYYRADLFVLPCLNIPGDVEGFGIVFSEAALAFTPALSTRVGGIPDAVEEGVSGFLVDPGDWASMEERAIELLQNPTLRERMGLAAEKRVRSHLTWPVIVARYEEALRKLISSANPDQT